MKISPWILMAIGIVVIGAAIGSFIVWRVLQRAYWVPKPTDTFLVQTGAPLDTGSPTDLGDGEYTYTGANAGPPDVYIIDGNNNPGDTVDALHARGAHVICEVPFVQWSPSMYSASDPKWAPLEGASAPGGGRWLDVSPKNPDFHNLIELMTLQFENCAQAHFDGVVSDTVDVLGHGTGADGQALTQSDVQTYLTALVSIAHSVGMSIGQADGMSQAPTLAPHFDFAVVHNCFSSGDCGLTAPYATAHKAIFEIETAAAPAHFCPPAAAGGRSAGRYNPALNGRLRVPCT
jgi:hypothetical protein